MINALPSSNQSNAGSGGSPMPTATAPATGITPPPPVMAGITPPTETPVPVDAVPAASQPHIPTSGYADSLSKKIHGESVTSSADTATGPILTPPSSYQPDKSLDTPPSAPQKKFNPKTILIALVFGLVIAGGGAGYYLTQRNQDVRQQAASEEVTNTETSRTATEWGIFSQQWNDFLNDPNNDWVSYVEFSQAEGARYKCDEPIMKVGEETLYGCDLNALFILYEPEAYIQPKAIGPQDPALNAVLDAVITNSGLLQEAQKRELVTLDDSIYNSSTKDQIARIDKLRELRETIGNSFNKTVDYEAVTIYFHNQIDPKIPLTEAQVAAKAKMDVLYTRLKSGEITMEQAGAEIAADNITGDTTGVSLANLDTLYKENAYASRVGHVFDARFFKDPSLDEELRSLGEGQMSTVRLCQDYSFTDEEYFASLESGSLDSPLVDSCYVIFKLNKINFGWLEEGSSDVSAEDFIKKSYSQQTTKQTENFKQ